MREIEIKSRELDFNDYVKRSAIESDFETLITEEALITEGGNPKILYAKLEDEKTKYLRQAVKNIKYQKSTRSNGLKTTSRIFGYSPRLALRNDYCSATSLAEESPTEHSVICDFGKTLSELYLKYFPETHKKHSETTEEKMLDEWTIPETPFTSGIVNKNNPLKYHFDSGNLKDVLSNMVVFKNGVGGGYLSCPEYNIGFEVADNTVILFDGQNILHGVTPIKNKHPKGYRYSVVYYTLQQIWNCEPLDQEMARIRKVKAKREEKRINGGS